MDEQTKQMVGDLMDQLEYMAQRMAAKSFVNKLADYNKAYFEALLRNGFTRAEAIELMKSASLVGKK